MDGPAVVFTVYILWIRFNRGDAMDHDCFSSRPPFEFR